MRVILAPMQGVLDPFVRELLTEVNEYDLCITEFVRVVDQLLPEKVFYRLCPELKNQGFTPSKTPVRVQLLGQHPNCLAENANRAIELGSHGIDLNCGCPSKTVNGSNGGAALLKQPELIYQATLALRKTVPSHLPVSVKVRLGWDCTSQAFEIADAVQQGGYQQSSGPTLSDAYKVLGVSENDDRNAVKRAYRRLMNEHHPDKLVAKGLPPEMMEMAKEKAQQIQAAYDLICKVKGWK